jgi:hypothetical protein
MWGRGPPQRKNKYLKKKKKKKKKFLPGDHPRPGRGCGEGHQAAQGAQQ